MYSSAVSISVSPTGFFATSSGGEPALFPPLVSSSLGTYIPVASSSDGPAVTAAPSRPSPFESPEKEIPGSTIDNDAAAAAATDDNGSVEEFDHNGDAILDERGEEDSLTSRGSRSSGDVSARSDDAAPHDAGSGGARPQPGRTIRKGNGGAIGGPESASPSSQDSWHGVAFSVLAAVVLLGAALALAVARCRGRPGPTLLLNSDASAGRRSAASHDDAYEDEDDEVEEGEEASLEAGAGDALVAVDNDSDADRDEDDDELAPPLISAPLRPQDR